VGPPEDDLRQYLISGAILAFSAWLFDAGVRHAAGQVFIWMVVFFFASAGASSGYLTVSEIFPVEIRAEAIVVFFAIAQISVRSDRYFSAR
jgi:hypothetical protein